MRSAASHVMIAVGRWNKCNLGPDCVAEEQSLILALPQSLVALPRPSYRHGNPQPPPSSTPPPHPPPGLPTRHPCGKQAHFHVTVSTSELHLRLWRNVTGDMCTRENVDIWGNLRILQIIKVNQFRYRPGVAQRVGSRKLRFPDFMTTAQGGGKVVSLMHRPHLPPGNSPGTHFC